VRGARYVLAVSRIELETLITAPVERCFDLSLSVELHLHSTASTGERVVAGVSSGLLKLGDQITWEARHLGLKHRLSMTISVVDAPRMFRDELVRGPFRRLMHDHFFEPANGGAMMRDLFEFSSGFPPLDALVLKPHLRRFLLRRNAAIKELAEGDRWRGYVPERASETSSRS
jgi:ligand-binding SRPBCC domain-containing protein